MSAFVDETFDASVIRGDFPILGRRVHGRPLVYLDSAATTQKPRAVIDAGSRFYEEMNSNVHRGVHALSQEATVAYEGARRRIGQFVNAAEDREVIFVRGATEAINLVAATVGRTRVGEGDEVVVSSLEHHSNIVPWQMLCEASGAHLRVIPMTDDGDLDLDAYRALLGPRTRFVAVGHVSNALGTVNPIREIVTAAHEAEALVLVDGAQATPHAPVDVQALGCDFYAFSGHKMYGPTGIGILWGRAALLEDAPPYQGGGDMIRTVSFEHTEYNTIPNRFEAGTPNIAGAVGLGAAVEYLDDIGLDAIAAHERVLVDDCVARLDALPGVTLVGRPKERAGVVSFLVDGVHPHDIGTIVDQAGVAVRAGHHCAQPVMDRLGVSATVRASYGLYNTTADTDALVAALEEVWRLFGR